MIPSFPKFKNVELSDREAVEECTHRFPPYSDFNFTSLWAWDPHGERALSKLHDNLVIKFTDYHTHEPFLSFLGENNTEETVHALLDYSVQSGYADTLRLIPASSVSDIRSSSFVVREDRDYFDYIYDLEEMATFHHPKHKKKRALARRLFREHPTMYFEVVDLENARTLIQETFSKWRDLRSTKIHTHELDNEEKALTRICESAPHHTCEVGALFENGVMCAFTIDELLPNEYVMGHFWKTRENYPGMYEALAQKMSSHLQVRGARYWNWEQDLGAPALRYSKSSFRPCQFLKRYTIRKN